MTLCCGSVAGLDDPLSTAYMDSQGTDGWSVSLVLIGLVVTSPGGTNNGVAGGVESQRPPCREVCR